VTFVIFDTLIVINICNMPLARRFISSLRVTYPVIRSYIQYTPFSVILWKKAYLLVGWIDRSMIDKGRLDKFGSGGLRCGARCKSLHAALINFKYSVAHFSPELVMSPDLKTNEMKDRSSYGNLSIASKLHFCGHGFAN